MTKAELYTSPIANELSKEISPEEFQQVETNMLLAACIDDAMKAKGWNKNHLAKALGTTPSQITKWLSGTHNFTPDTLLSISNILDIKLL
jgi:ribosome-binding protein aMBF1 (putative translation factor)